MCRERVREKIRSNAGDAARPEDTALEASWGLCPRLCYIGAGRLDGFIDLRGTLRVTDAAAGMLVCSEAGGKVTDLNGHAIRFPNEVTVGRCLVATNGVLHHKVIEYLR